MKKKIDPDTYREELQDAKRLFILKKKGSPHTLEYIEDPEDDWFVYVVKIRNTSKKFESCSMIIQKDIETWMNVSLQEGWVIATAN
jgi:hypothetical protein